MKKLKEYLPLSVMICLLVACWAEFVLCFLRGYEELWYTILIPSVIVSALAAAGYFTKHRWLYCIATEIIMVGAILLIGFPSYILFAGLAFGALSLAGEIALLIFYLKERNE